MRPGRRLLEPAGHPTSSVLRRQRHRSLEASDPYRHVMTAEGQQAVESLAAWVDSQERERRWWVDPSGRAEPRKKPQATLRGFLLSPECSNRHAP